MIRNLLLALATALFGVGAGGLQAAATTLMPGLGGASSIFATPAYSQPELRELKGMLAACCDNPDGTGSGGMNNAGSNNIGIGNTGAGNIGIGNTGIHNIGVDNGSAHNLGAFNGRGNASPTSGNGNIGIGNGNGNTSAHSGNGNVGVGNGNGNASANSGNGNVGMFNGNFNGIGSVGDGTTGNGNNNFGAFNGNLNGVGNVGDGNGSYNGNNNVGIFNGNRNGSANVGSGNGNGNGNGNVGAFSGNLNGDGNVGTASGNANGNDNTGVFNGNQNGDGNIGAYNGNVNGNRNVGTHNGNQNGGGNVGAYNGNWNGNDNVEPFDLGENVNRSAASKGAGGDLLQQTSLITLTPDPTASDGDSVTFGRFESTYDFTLNEASDVEFGGIAVGIFDFDIDLCVTAACLDSDLINSGTVVHGLLSIAGGWPSDLGAGTYYLLVSGFGSRSGGAYLAGIIATPVASTPLPGAVLIWLTGMVPLICCFHYRRPRRSELPQQG